MNHWVFYLELARGGSVRLDMIPGETTCGDATFVVSQLGYSVLWGVVKEVEFEVTQSLCVSGVIKDILGQKRH